jgi:hypothetical protein
MYAASENHREVVKALLARPDIDLKAQNRYGLEAGDVTTCPILKGLLRGSSGIDPAPLTVGAPDLKPPPVDSRSPKGPHPTLARHPLTVTVRGHDLSRL